MNEASARSTATSDSFSKKSLRPLVLLIAAAGVALLHCGGAPVSDESTASSEQNLDACVDVDEDGTAGDPATDPASPAPVATDSPAVAPEPLGTSLHLSSGGPKPPKPPSCARPPRPKCPLTSTVDCGWSSDFYCQGVDVGGRPGVYGGICCAKTSVTNPVATWDASGKKWVCSGNSVAGCGYRSSGPCP